MTFPEASAGAQALPRYFFHVQNGSFIPDHSGAELASEQEARHHAIALGAETLRRESETFSDGTEWQITTTDQDGIPLFTLNFHAQLASARRNARKPEPPFRGDE